MEQANGSTQIQRRGDRVRGVSASVVAVLMAVAGNQANAFSLKTDNPDIDMRWDNTAKYSAAWRLKNPDPVVAGSTVNSNLDDGDLNFGKGLISNRVDLLSEFDFSYKKTAGFRVSGAAWYDDVYQHGTDNHSPSTTNNVSAAYNEFNPATKKLHGNDAEFLDAFVWGRTDLGDDKTLSVRAGRYTLLYGESLFLGGNGIAGAQSSIDVVKALSVPNVQFKEIGRPIGQLSGDLQLSSNLSLGAYYQLEWRKYRVPGAGSYFSVADVLDTGAEALYAPAPGFGPGGLYFQRGTDIKARNSGQGGMQVRFKTSPNWEFGVYAAQFHDKTPKIYVRPGINAAGPTAFGVAVGDYVLVYPEDIRVFGASFATVVGDTNVSGEISMRSNQPLAGANGDVFVDPTGKADNNGNPLYPVGRTFHANVSAISLLPATKLWDGASVVGELGFNRRLNVSNGLALDPSVTRDAFGMRVSFEPNYFQVIPDVDLTVPIGLGYAFGGRSSLGPNVFGPNNGGDFSIALNADYHKQVKFGLQYTHYLGTKGPLTLDPVLRQYSYYQTYADRDFISFSIQTSF